MTYFIVYNEGTDFMEVKSKEKLSTEIKNLIEDEGISVDDIVIYKAIEIQFNTRIKVEVTLKEEANDNGKQT